MAKQCRSSRRAIRRGHYIDVTTGCYHTKKKSTAFRKKINAILIKAIEQTQTEETNE